MPLVLGYRWEVCLAKLPCHRCWPRVKLPLPRGRLAFRIQRVDCAPGALDSDIAVNSAFGFCDLLFDSAQAASSPNMGVLEVSPTAVSQPDASGGG